ncbi:MAG: hypothetical protein ACLS3C_18165 [Oscillospiraceae bacterium]
MSLDDVYEQNGTLIVSAGAFMIIQRTRWYQLRGGKIYEASGCLEILHVAANRSQTDNKSNYHELGNKGFHKSLLCPI